MLGNRIAYILLLIVLAGVYIFTDSYFSLMLIVLFVLMTVLSCVLMIGAKRTLNVSVVKNKRGIECVINSGKFAAGKLIFTLTADNELTGAHEQRKFFAAVSGKSRAGFSLGGLGVGVVTVSFSAPVLYDCFGLFKHKLKDLPDTSWEVYPKFCGIELYAEEAKEIAGDGDRYSEVRPGSDPSELFALREYAPGDEMRRIHWKLSNKTDKLIVREFGMPLNYSVFLLIELERGDVSELNACVTAAASISAVLIENGIFHNIAWFDRAKEKYIVREVSDIEEFQVAEAELISSYSYSEHALAADSYLMSGFGKHSIIYVTTVADEERLTALSSHPLKTILISKNPGNVEGDVTVMKPAEVKEGFRVEI